MADLILVAIEVGAIAAAAILLLVLFIAPHLLRNL